MNEIRIIQCGTTIFAIGQLFDPNNLVDPRTVNDPIQIAEHQFDGFGMVEPTNDERVSVAGA